MKVTDRSHTVSRYLAEHQEDAEKNMPLSRSITLTTIQQDARSLIEMNREKSPARNSVSRGKQRRETDAFENTTGGEERADKEIRLAPLPSENSWRAALHAAVTIRFPLSHLLCAPHHPTAVTPSRWRLIFGETLRCRVTIPSASHRLAPCTFRDQIENPNKLFRNPGKKTRSA